jgi:hypothetical protein
MALSKQLASTMTRRVFARWLTSHQNILKSFSAAKKYVAIKSTSLPEPAELIEWQSDFISVEASQTVRDMSIVEVEGTALTKTDLAVSTSEFASVNQVLTRDSCGCKVKLSPLS